MLEKYAFLDYAANLWCSHSTINGKPSRNLVDAMNRLFDPGASRWILWADIVRRHDVQSKSRFGVTDADNYGHLHYILLLLTVLWRLPSLY